MRKNHTQSFKIKAVEKALNRAQHQTLGQVADQLSIGYSTLTRWMYEVKQGKLSEDSSAMLTKLLWRKQLDKSGDNYVDKHRNRP